MPSLLGTLLDGRYRLDAEVGSGGMSTVYRAFDTVLERPVAIKLMHRDIASRPDQIERFRREARAVAQLNHPHIVTVIDAGDDEGTPYIVFEYVEGETLKERIRRVGRLPIPEAIAYAIEIARALGAAHERAIVHRDVKPQNVLIDDEGSAKVTDFGIARTLTEEGLTADGRVLGTTDYVSPEQALGRPVTGQSDIYSLGVVLYEMLAGHPPFVGDSQVAVAMRHVRDEVPDLQKRRPDASAALAAVVERATAKELDRRYMDVASLVGDLEEVLAIETARTGDAPGEATTVLRTLPGRAQRRVPLRLRHRGWLALALVAVVAGVVILAVVAANRTQRGTGVRSLTPPPQTEAVSLAQSAAHDYDPIGGDGEHPSEASFVVDDVPTTTWSTETYNAGALNKAGVGIYLDAKPGVAARVLQIRSPTPAWSVEVYASRDSVPRSFPDPRWQKVGADAQVSTRQRIDLDTARRRFRYYLVWITALPPDGERVEIAELALFR
jgi:tRNA A-37 threonylcarbamoyl transferase component Bud32